MQMKPRGRERAVPSLSRATQAQGVCRTRAVPKSGCGGSVKRWVVSSGGLHLQAKGLGRASASGQAPQVDGQTPGGRHRQPPLGALASAAAQPLDGRVVRLPAHQAPDHFDQRVPHCRVAAAVNGAFPAPAIAVVDARAQAGVTANLTTIYRSVPTRGSPVGASSVLKAPTPRGSCRLTICSNWRRTWRSWPSMASACACQ
jgi:hypothetical protein